MKRSTTSALTLVLLTALAGCGTGGTRPAPPQLGEIPTITGVGQVVRPIDVYLPTAAQTRTVERAAYLTSALCLRRLGISEPPGPDPARAEPADRDVRSQLYGYFAPDRVATTGYDAVVATGAGQPTSAATLQVLTGRDAAGTPVTDFQGRTVPKGGCLQEGLNAVGGAVFLSSDPSALPGGGPKEPLTDPRVVAADRQWSSCMKDHGFTYATPADAYMDPRWRDRTQGATTPAGHTPAELATAAADDACKRSTNFMGIAVAVQAAYDRQYIAAHPQELATFAQGASRHVADAQEVVADGAAG
ncbi:hypothetical protein AB0D10_39390 [Kitasatospora sp. NPDC048545]|uniref:hypothetical protein n=1 Tax=Kitasatospora sp. NPDC048545 TaxID=3157208 RepID=UPI003403D79C